MNKHLTYVNEHSLQVTEYSKIDSKDLIFDIETCYVDEKMLNKDYPQGDKKRKVWAFGLGATNTNNVIFGCDLDEAFYTLQMIGFEQAKKENIKKNKNKRVITLSVAVHNVAYEISYMQYWLTDNGFTYVNPSLQTNELGISRTIENFKPMTFSIVQTDNVYYGLEVNLPNTLELSDKDGHVNTFSVKVKFWDTLKIVPCSLDKAYKFCNNLDEMFYKLKEEFDYDKIREDNHILTDIERRYLYNDIRILKEVINDYFYNSLLKFEYNDEEICISSNCKTSSSISFKSALEITYFEDRNKKKAFINQFEIEERQMLLSKMTREMENKSYEGGWTWYNPKIVNKVVKCNGSSFDINSSYPYQVESALLPYGMPEEYKGYVKPVEGEEVAIYNIGFDYFRPKSKKYELQMIRLGAKNFSDTALPILYRDKLNMVLMNGNSFIHTNIIDGKVIEIYRNGCENLCNYNMSITSVELEHLTKYYDFGYYENVEVDGFLFKEKDKVKFNGLKFGTSLVYKAEKGIFSNFVNHFYNLKSEIKHRIDKGEKLDAQYSAIKTILNSFYGKFGTRTTRTIDYLVKKDKIFTFDRGGKEKNLERVKKLKNEKRRNQILASGQYIETYESEPFYKPFASFVTAYARVYLQSMIIEGCGVENFLYSDTDSFYCSIPKEKVIEGLKKMGVEVHPNNLGAMDNEKNFKEFKTIGAKKYMLRTNDGKITCKCAGVPKDAQKILCDEGFGEFKLGKEVKGKLAQIKCDGGLDLVEVQYIIKDLSLRR